MILNVACVYLERAHPYPPVAVEVVFAYDETASDNPGDQWSDCWAKWNAWESEEVAWAERWVWP